MLKPSSGRFWRLFFLWLFTLFNQRGVIRRFWSTIDLDFRQSQQFALPEIAFAQFFGDDAVSQVAALIQLGGAHGVGIERFALGFQGINLLRVQNLIQPAQTDVLALGKLRSRRRRPNSRTISVGW